MDIIKAIAIMGTLLLFFVLALSALSASSQALPDDTTEETRKSREGLWLIILSLFVILAVLVWRAL